MLRSLCFSSLLIALYSFSLPSHATPCGEDGWRNPPMTLAGLGQSCSFYTGLGAQCVPGLMCVNSSFLNLGFGVCSLPNHRGGWHGGGRWGNRPGWGGGRPGWGGRGPRWGGGRR